MISCVMFYIIGYPIMYASGIDNLFMSGLVDSEKYSHWSDLFFQMVFVATAASVISGVVAERMKIIPFLIFVVILSGLIYPLAGSLVLGNSTYKEIFMNNFSDFARSTIVHSLGGWAALAAVFILGARKGKFTKSGESNAIMGSNLTLATLGTFILAFGWIGFNGGSVLSLTSKDDVNQIALVVVCTILGMSARAISSSILSHILWKKIDLTMVLNGTLGGLVSVTAGPNISANVSLIEGFIGGILVVFAILFIDKKLKLDDPVGALSVHLVCGIWGTLAVGIFNDKYTFMNQLQGIVIIGLITFILSYIVWFILNKTIGIRVDSDIEYEGLDIHETGLECYPEFKK